MSRSPLVGMVVGAGLGLGLLIVGGAWLGKLHVPTWWSARSATIDRLALRTCGLLAGAVAGWLLTGWLAVAAGAAMAGWFAPSVAGLRERRRKTMAQTEAVAIWAEMLRDLLMSNAGLREAISRSARVAPEAIRCEVQALEVRAQRGLLSSALERFAADLANPVADTVVLALLLAERRAVSDLGGMLADVAGSTRETVAMQRRINATRARTYRTSQLIAGVVAGAVVLLMITNRTYLEPFGSPVGQVVLVAVLGLVVTALWAMIRLSRPVQAARLLRVTGDRRTAR